MNTLQTVSAAMDSADALKKLIARQAVEIEKLRVKADLFDLAIRKRLITVHSERIDPRNQKTVCSWLEGHQMSCDISNDAAIAAINGKESK